MSSLQTGWGSDGKRAALSFTFDNMGEAADLEFGKWPVDEPVGLHYTVTEVLPELMERFTAGKVTFFVEAWNAETYPTILKELAARGHDVALHGWRHELWNKLEPDRQPDILRRSLDAFGKIGLRPSGFRPPGGSVALNPSPLLHEFGFTYYSAAGSAPGVQAGVAQIPFAWQHLDGVYLMPGGAAVAGLPSLPAAASLDGLRTAFHNAICKAIEHGEHLTLVFHPWLLGQDRERLRVLFELYEHATQNSDLWVAPCRDVAGWVLRDVSTPAAA
ncbi:MAG TPA: polysaccharide deacetylase family protein [Steroidobacteraceae bacterium]